jgi:phytoene dehydrogenase-like protein
VVRNSDVVVVGGGLAGLTAAVVASSAGARVTLLEARSGPGGRARSERLGGFLLNEGAHALYVDGEARAILERLGVRAPGRVPSATASAGLVDGRLVLLPVDARSLVRTTLLAWHAKPGAARLLATLPRLDPADLAGMTVGEWSSTATTDVTTRRLLHALVRVATYTEAPDHLDAGAALAQVQRSLGGSVRYLDGGWQRLVDQLRAIAVRRGVELRTDTRVHAVGPAPDGRVELAVAGGTTMTAGSAVLAVGGPRHAASLLGSARSVLAGAAGRAVPSTVSTLDVCLDVPWGTGPSFVLGIDEPLYLSLHGPVADVAPQDGSLVSLVRYHQHGEVEDPARTSARLEAMLDAVRPGWRDHVVHRRFRRRAVVTADVPGAASGGLAGRTPVTGSGVPGVLVAGDWVGPSGMLADAAVASGEDAGRRAAVAAAQVRAAA